MIANLEMIELMIPCPRNCGKYIKKDAKQIRRHLNFDCNLNRKFRCAICSRPFKRKYHLQRHYATLHKAQAQSKTDDL